MRRIDKETVQKILDSADVVEVVSDFVALKRRGANYMGLCPFHNERTPSFSVSKAKGIYKCFSCGKGGSAVNFVMEHEQMGYNEALRYLAKKYNIEIKEHDLTPEERQADTAREAMFAVNDFAMKYFERMMAETADGRDIGLAYFRERGISDAAIARFHLGYSPERGVTLARAASEAGFAEQYLVDTGLVVRRDDGTTYDRFRSRVIYPVHTISGKVVAFGGRTLRSDKKVAKYVNSPESIIYKKSNELYGLFQAKRSIVEKKKCILVEGYMDVISMSQLGIENVVASSGTSLTDGQIRLIHRFTDNVTVIYDSDPAGIKASLRGIDMLLAEGLNIKVVLLPDGEDPDSFAQSHSLTEVEEYISANERDFIGFKTEILLADTPKNDPTARAAVITDILRSISVIPDDIARSLYTQECSRSLGVDEKVLLGQIRKLILERREKQADERRRRQAVDSIDHPIGSETTTEPAASPTVEPPVGTATSTPTTVVKPQSSPLEPYEREITRLIIKYGMVGLPTLDEEGNTIYISVLEYLCSELQFENIAISTPAYSHIVDLCTQLASTTWADEYARAVEQSEAERQTEWQQGVARLQETANNLAQIQAGEKLLTETIEEHHNERLSQFTELFFVHHLLSSPDDTVRNIATSLADTRYQLSKIHSKYARVLTERDRLADLLPRAVYSLKDAIVRQQINTLRDQLKQAATSHADAAVITNLMQQIADLDAKRQDYARALGERVILPK